MISQCKTEDEVPEEVRVRVAEVVELLNNRGIEYQECLLQEEPPIQFLFAKSPHYEYYISQLYERMPRPRKQPSLHLVYHGDPEHIAVGAMCDLLKMQLRQGKSFEPRNYTFQTDFDPQDPTILAKTYQITQLIRQTIRPKQKSQKTKSNKERADNTNIEIGTNADGSFGNWAGHKYQGLGNRNQFTLFRQAQSKNYYTNLNGKKK